jgi:hypothetical protein
MNQESKLLWVVRVSWPLFGGVWGATLGIGGLFQLPHNADSFGSMFAQGFFISTALIGLCAGIACGLLVGGLTEKLVRSLGIGAGATVCVATVVNALVVWQLVGAIQAQYPGLRSPAVKQTTGKSQAPVTPRPEYTNPCSQPPPPAHSKERASWDAECR